MWTRTHHDDDIAFGFQSFLEFAETLVRDIKRGVIASGGKVHVHLIGIFKESGSHDTGVQYWKWLVEQDEEQVDVDCYGAAIELLAVSGTPLADLEKLQTMGYSDKKHVRLSPGGQLTSRDITKATQYGFNHQLVKDKFRRFRKEPQGKHTF